MYRAHLYRPPQGASDAGALGVAPAQVVASDPVGAGANDAGSHGGAGASAGAHGGNGDAGGAGASAGAHGGSGDAGALGGSGWQWQNLQTALSERTFVSSPNCIGSWRWQGNQPMVDGHTTYSECDECGAAFTTVYGLWGRAPQAYHIGGQTRCDQKEC